MNLTLDERLFVEVLRRCSHVGGFLTEWAEEVEVSRRMTDEELRRYVFHWLDGDVVYDHVRERLCEECDAPTVDDYGYSECCACNDVMSAECWKADEVSYPLRVLVMADMMLRGVWGDGYTTA